MASQVQARITAAEYAALPETTTPTQLIDGEVITMPSPKTNHQRAVARLLVALQQLSAGGEFFIAPLDVILDDHNVVQPDLFWVSGPESACKPGDDGLWHGAPDLVIEVLSESTGRLDRREKFDLYQKHGTREYWLVDPDPAGGFIEVYRREADHFQRAGVFGPEDTIESAVLGSKKVNLTPIFAV